MGGASCPSTGGVPVAAAATGRAQAAVPTRPRDNCSSDRRCQPRAGTKTGPARILSCCTRITLSTTGTASTAAAASRASATSIAKDRGLAWSDAVQGCDGKGCEPVGDLVGGNGEEAAGGRDLAGGGCGDGDVGPMPTRRSTPRREMDLTLATAPRAAAGCACPRPTATARGAGARCVRRRRGATGRWRNSPPRRAAASRADRIDLGRVTRRRDAAGAVGYCGAVLAGAAAAPWNVRTASIFRRHPYG